MALNLSFKTARLRSTLWIRPKARVVVRGLDELPSRRPGEKRVYLLINRSTSFDLAALMHISEEPFSLIADGDAAGFPQLRSMMKGAKVIPQDGRNQDVCVSRGMAALDAGLPLVVAPGQGEGVPPVGIRVARAAGAGLYPVFVKAEEDRMRNLRLRGGNDGERSYTTIKDSFYFVEFLKPVDLSALPAAPTDADCAEVEKRILSLRDEVASRYEAYLEENRERFAPLKRRGGSRLRVAW